MPTRSRAKTAKGPAKTAAKAGKVEKSRKKELVLTFFRFFGGTYRSLFRHVHLKLQIGQLKFCDYFVAIIILPYFAIFCLFAIRFWSEQSNHCLIWIFDCTCTPVAQNNEPFILSKTNIRTPFSAPTMTNFLPMFLAKMPNRRKKQLLKSETTSWPICRI